MEYLQHLLESTGTPFWSAILLGLMTAISPCPLATNITAVGFISKDIEDKKRIFINGLLYTLGRALSYTTIGLILYFGASTFKVAKLFQTYGERFLGPLLIIVGILMLDVLKIKFPGFNSLSNKVAGNNQKSWWSPLLLGVIFALAFCPYSGVLYFGVLIPMTVASSSGLYLPIIFAIATGLPVIIIAWILAFSVAGIGNFYNKIKTFEKWFRIITAIAFIIVGIYYSFNYFSK